MNVKWMLPGFLAATAGVWMTADLTFTGPSLPDSPVEVAGWMLVLGGLLEMKIVARTGEQA